MKQIIYPWIIYDTESIPNKLLCKVCGEKIIITSPARMSTMLVMGKKFAEAHKHEKRKSNIS